MKKTADLLSLGLYYRITVLSNLFWPMDVSLGLGLHAYLQATIRLRQVTFQTVGLNILISLTANHHKKGLKTTRLLSSHTT